MDPYNKITSSINKLQSDLTNDLLSAGYVTGILLGIVGFVLLIIEISMFYKIHKINNWPIIRDGGTIRDSYMESTSGTTSYSIFVVSESYTNLYYRTRASFLYTINGKLYINNKISYYEPWESDPTIAKIENDTLSKGTKIDIRINPLDNSEAYIFNKSYSVGIRFYIAIILSIVGVYAIYKI